MNKTTKEPISHQEQPNEDYFECINNYLDGIRWVSETKGTMPVDEIIRKALENKDATPVFVSRPGCGLLNKIQEVADEMDIALFKVSCPQLIDTIEINAECDLAINYAKICPDTQILLVFDGINHTHKNNRRYIIDICATRQAANKEFPANLQIAITRIVFPDDNEGSPNRINTCTLFRNPNTPCE